MPANLTGAMQRYLAGNKIYRGGSNASYLGVKEKEGFRRRSQKQNNTDAMRRRMQALYPNSTFPQQPKIGRPKKVTR